MCVRAQYNGEPKTECFDESTANAKPPNLTQGTAGDKSQPASSSASQIIWVPKIQSQQDASQPVVTLVSTTTTQPPPLYSRIKQMNYSQVDFSFNFCFSFFVHRFPAHCFGFMFFVSFLPLFPVVFCLERRQVQTHTIRSSLKVVCAKFSRQFLSKQANESNS